MKSKLFIMLFSSFLILAVSCNKSGVSSSASEDEVETEAENPTNSATEGEATLQMPKFFNGAAFALNSSYTTASGNQVQIKEVRYWVSNVKFVKEDNSEVVVPDAYYLISENELVAGDETGERVPNFDLAAGKRENITLKRVPVGTYKSIKFNVGVDSAYNNDLSKRAGELHLFSHMTNITWSWVTSYIFGKTTGVCTNCSGQQNFALEFGSNANLQTVTLAFSSNITVSGNSKPTIVAKVDVEKMFTGIDIGTLSVDSGVSKRAISGFQNAGQMATVGSNFASAFSLDSVSNNSISEPQVASVTINVTKEFNGTPFALNTNFTDAHGNTLKFTRFRYWISNVKLIKADTSEYSVPDSYYHMTENSLISPDNINSGMNIAAKKREQISIKEIPAATYTGIKFSIGIDPTYNDNLSLQSGDLHIHQDMANYTWMWNSSYLFSQITGSCESCSAPKNLAFDIGANANYRVLSTMNFPASMTLTKGKNATIQIKADVSKLFEVNGSAGVNTSTVSSAGARYIHASTNSALMGNLANAYQNYVFSVSTASVE